MQQYVANKKQADAKIREARRDSANKKKAWKNKSSAFRDAMRQGKAVQKALKDGTELPPPLESEPDPSLVPCPHCGRTFNAKAAERHIPRCKGSGTKPTRSRAGRR